METPKIGECKPKIDYDKKVNDAFANSETDCIELAGFNQEQVEELKNYYVNVPFQFIVINDNLPESVCGMDLRVAPAIQVKMSDDSTLTVGTDVAKKLKQGKGYLIGEVIGMVKMNDYLKYFTQDSEITPVTKSIDTCIIAGKDYNKYCRLV